MANIEDLREDYDVIIMGTGLKEGMLSALMSVQGRRVLHIDAAGHYGGETASLSLDQLYERFRGGESPPESLGRSRDWNIDLVPKFVMGFGTLVDLLIYTGVNSYLEFRVR